MERKQLRTNQIAQKCPRNSTRDINDSDTNNNDNHHIDQNGNGGVEEEDEDEDDDEDDGGTETDDSEPGSGSQLVFGDEQGTSDGENEFDGSTSNDDRSTHEVTLKHGHLANGATAEIHINVKHEEGNETDSESFDVPGSPRSSTSLDDMDFGEEIGGSEDELDVERFENEAIVQEEEDKHILHQKFNGFTDEHPFAFAREESDDRNSNGNEEEDEDIWIEDFDALVGGNVPFETTAIPKFALDMVDADALLEEEFFLGYCSSEGEQDAQSDGDEADADDDDRIGFILSSSEPY